MDIKFLVTRDNVHPPRKGRVFWRSWERSFWSPWQRLAGGERGGAEKASPHSWQPWLHPNKELAKEQGLQGAWHPVSMAHSILMALMGPASWLWIHASDMQDSKRKKWSPRFEKSPRSAAEWNAASVSAPGVLAQSAPQIRTLVPSRSPAKKNWPTHPSVSLLQFGTPRQQGPPRPVPGLQVPDLESDAHTAPGRSRTDRWTQMAREPGRRLRAGNKLVSLRNG